MEYKNVKVLVGDSFAKVAFNVDTHLDKVILVTHPQNHKNFRSQEALDAIAKKAQASSDKHGTQFFLYNGINECPSFKITAKLPAIYFVRANLPLSEDP